MTSLLVWGRGDQGQLGLGGGLEDPLVCSPVEVARMPWMSGSAPDLPKEAITQVCGGDRHTMVLSAGGKLFSFGSNDFGQLGRDGAPESVPEHVSGLDEYNIVAAACGKRHTLAVDKWGKLFAWGEDSCGQAGHNLGVAVIPVPRMIRGLGTVSVVQVAAGSKHSLVLTNGGRLYSFGDNSSGQLGLGQAAGDRMLTPQPLDVLSGLPVHSIACGGSHSVAVSLSGAVYTWGKNSFGQLGLGSQEDKSYPTQVRSLRHQKVVYVSCGEDHTVCLTKDGGVFSFGCGRYGQLGHGGNSNEMLPRKIMELMGTEVTQIACGKHHTLAFVSSRCRVYAFGLGGSGQLAQSSKQNASTPCLVVGPWQGPRHSGTRPQDVKAVFLIGAAGDQSFAACSSPSVAAAYVVEQRQVEGNCGGRVLTLTTELGTAVGKTEKEHVLDQDFLEKVETVFQSRSCLNGSMLLAESHMPCTSRNSGIDFGKWQEAFTSIAKCKNETLADAIHTSFTTFIVPNLNKTPPDVETLRIFLTLPLYRRFADPTLYDELQTPFATSLISLQKNPFTVVERWISERDSAYLLWVVGNLKAVTVHLLKKRKEHVNVNSAGRPPFKYQLDANLTFLRILNRINVEKDLIIDYEDFYIPEVVELIYLPEAYARWLQEKSTTGGASSVTEFHICNYPFVFDAKAKMTLLHVDQIIQMHNARLRARAHSFFNQDVMGPEEMNYLVLRVSRENIVQDTLMQIRGLTTDDLKMPLRIYFVGEEAEDAGGVRKEFFLFLSRDLLDPKYGMFKSYEETRTIWFFPRCFEENVMFYLIGVLCGLAIYNNTIIPLPFPLLLYKKLLGGKIGSVDDVEELSPVVANGLRDLLKYEGDDLDDVFGLNFTISESCYGEVVTEELKKSGDSIPVTQANKEEYVELYCDYVLNKSIEEQYKAFHQGFHMVCGGRVLDLFHARELMSLVVGLEHYDWNALEESTSYKNGYSKDSPTIQNFWSVFHELSEENKKKFLLFVTGCDRIPISGMNSVRLIIQRTAEDKFLPAAHTCFNLLDLPDYGTREKLKYMLTKAIQHTEGFGLA